MRLLLTIAILAMATACGYVPHAPNVQPKFTDDKQVDITFSFNTFGGEYDDSVNREANNTFWFYDEALERIKQDFQENPLVGSVSYSEHAKPGTFHLEIEYYFGNPNAGMPQMMLSMITLGIIPAYFDIDRQITINVRDPDGFPAGKTLQEANGTAQMGWFTLFQGSSFNPSNNKKKITEQISENVKVATYKLYQGGTFSGSF